MMQKWFCKAYLTILATISSLKLEKKTIFFSNTVRNKYGLPYQLKIHLTSRPALAIHLGPSL